MLLENLPKNHYLGFWVSKETKLKDDDGKLSQDAIIIEKLPRQSSNKIPGSKPIDLHISLKSERKKELTKSWNVGDDALMPFNKDFEIVLDRNSYFLQIAKIDGKKGDYLKGNPPKQVQSNFVIEVTHKPLVSNYWHFEFEIFEDTDPPRTIKKLDSTLLKKLVGSKIRQVIQDHAVFNL